MNRQSSLKSKLILIMTTLILMQTGMLIFSLFITKTFYKMDQNAFMIFNNSTNNQLTNANLKIGKLVENVCDADKELNLYMTYALNEKMKSEDSYDDVMIKASTILEKLIDESEVSGAFVIFDEENAKLKKLLGNNPAKTIYMRTTYGSTNDVIRDNIFLKIGPTAIIKKLGLSSATDWQILGLRSKEFKNNPIYKNPINALNMYPDSDLARYGYWNEPSPIFEYDRQYVTFSLPIFDKDNEPLGIIGIDLHSNFFADRYLFLTKSPFPNSYFAVLKCKDNYLLADNVISQNNSANMNFKENSKIYFHPSNLDGIYRTNFNGLENTYLSINNLTLYGENSPFKEKRWALVGFVDNQDLRENSKDVRQTIWFIIIITSIVLILVGIILSERFTKNISSITYFLSNIKPDKPVKFEKTNLIEIDGLTSAIEKLNSELVRLNQITSSIFELSLLSIGGFEMRYDSGITSITTYVSKLFGLDPKAISMPNEQWQTYLDRLKSMVYSYDEGIYKFTTFEQETIYIRITEKEMLGSRIGAIVDVTKEVAEKIKYTKMLETDALTGLYTKSALESKCIKKIDKNPISIGAIVFLDLDNLKYVNDNYGHEAGDELIIAAADLFAELNKDGAIVSRISGDEFAIFLYGFNTKEELIEIVRKHLIYNEKKYIQTPTNEFLPVRYSMGLSWYPYDSLDIKELLKFADSAMHESKSTEKGNLTEFNLEYYLKNKYIIEKSESIIDLIDNELIKFAFQPIIDVKNKKLYGYEALMRSKMASFKEPSEIIEVAKHQSKLRAIERLVFKVAFETLHSLRGVLNNEKIFINSIPRFMITKEELKKIQEQFPFDINNVVIEITETEFDVVENESSDTLNELKKAGVKIAVDDFGKGYSGEIRVLNTSPDIVKIDIDLIKDIQNDPRKQKLVANLISYCHSTGTLALAEGVESHEELVEVISLGVDLVQGFYLAGSSFDLSVPTDSIIKKLKLVENVNEKMN